MTQIKEIKKEYYQKFNSLSCFGIESYKVAKGIDDIWNFIESTISQTRKEVIEEIYTSGMIADGMYDPRRVVAYVDHLHRKLLEDLNKK